MKRDFTPAWLLAALTLSLLLVSACPQQPTSSTAIGKRLPRANERTKPVTAADIDLAGNDNAELKVVASKLLDNNGAFVASGRLTPQEWGKLKKQLSEKVESEPMPFAYYLLAGVENALGAGSDAAQKAAREAVELSPDSAWANDLLGQVLLMGGRDDEAKAAFDKALKLAGKGVLPPYSSALSGGRDDEVARGGRDDEVARGGRDDEVAKSKLEKSLETGAAMSYANYAPDLKLALQAAPEEKLKPETLSIRGVGDADLANVAARILTPQGYFYRDKDLTEEAWAELMYVLQTKAGEGKSAFASWLYAGSLLVQENEIQSPTLKKAIPAAKKALELDPESALANYLYGVALALSGASDKAISPLAKAAKLNPDFAAPHLALADVYARIGNDMQAKSELEAVAKMEKASKAEKATAAAKLKALAAK